MKKFVPIAFLALFSLTAAPLFAEDACCAHGAKQAKNASKKEMCAASFANLNLTPKQKTQMEKLTSECMSAGCTEQSMAKAEKSARKVLNKEQFATWKSASCCAGKGEQKHT